MDGALSMDVLSPSHLRARNASSRDDRPSNLRNRPHTAHRGGQYTLSIDAPASVSPGAYASHINVSLQMHRVPAESQWSQALAQIQGHS